MEIVASEVNDYRFIVSLRHEVGRSERLNLMVNLGCDLVQGYCIPKSQSADGLLPQ